MNVQPTLSCVVIGINCEKTLFSCLESIQKSDYYNITEIIYVDGGSNDTSIKIAKSVRGVKVVALSDDRPTPGKGRNAGWQISKGEWIHFFDADTVVDKIWISKAVECVNDNTAAIYGQRKEMYPCANVFHIIADLEWKVTFLSAKFFGGDVLIKKSVLEKTGGYDTDLIAGEDPELSSRIINKGWKIKKIYRLMCYHNINMNSLCQYFKRSFRSGYAFADAGIKMLRANEKGWTLQIARILSKPALIIFLLAIYAAGRSWVMILLIFLTIFFPLLKLKHFQKKYDLTLKTSFIYSLHCILVLWIELIGVICYFAQRINKFIKR